MNEQIEKFIAALQASLAASDFIKLTLSNYKGTEQHLQKVSARPVDLKKGRRLMFQYRYATRDVVKNFEFDESVVEVQRLLDLGFRSGHLFTTTNDMQLTIGKKSSRLVAGKPSLRTTADPNHNRQKKSLIDPNVFYLKALGIATDDGKIRADQRDKWKQINKFVEVLANLIENSSLKDKQDLRIVDMGSGKGYLTFALYDYLTKSSPPYEGGVTEALRGRGGSLMQKPARTGPPARASRSGVASKGETSIRITGVELRPELVALCNDLARSGGFDGLNFVQGTIADTGLDNVDILIALHACDTATDDALYKGISANAEIIVAAPCCHKEIKKQMRSPDFLAGILKHPVMLERTAETITDGIRSMLLESKGYKTKMFEFVRDEHTPKNNLLVATRAGAHGAGGAPRIDEQIRNLRSEFGIEHQRLLSLIGEQ